MSNLHTNVFQDGISDVRAYMPKLLGCRLETEPGDAFTGYWDCEQRVVGTIVSVLHDGPYVAGVQFEGDECVTRVTCATFMLQTTKWLWDHPLKRDDSVALPSGKKHDCAMERAVRLARELVARVGRKMHGKKIFFLDGKGYNRRAIELTFDEMDIPLEDRPDLINVELNPNVAFANALRFGRHHVRFSAGDFRMQVKKGHVCGIERAILLDSGILSSDEKANCVALYLDYCGSPQKNIDFRALYAELPKCAIIGLTVAKRQPNPEMPCPFRRRMAAPAENQFQLLHTYDHAKVMCDLYALPLDQESHKKRIACTMSEETSKHEVMQRKRQKLMLERQANAISTKELCTIQAEAAKQCIGKEVHIPISFWKGGDPGPDFAGVKRVKDALCFRVHGTFRKSKCSLRAVLTTGDLHPDPESFFLAPCDVKHFSPTEPDPEPEPRSNGTDRGLVQRMRVVNECIPALVRQVRDANKLLGISESANTTLSSQVAAIENALGLHAQ